LNLALTRLIGGFFCMHAALAGARMAAPLLALTLGHSKTAVGILVALFAVPQVLLAIPVGKWVDRNGTAPAVAWGAAAGTLGTLVAATWSVYAALCVAALAVGTAIGATAIALQRHVGRVAHTPAERRRAFAWLSMAPPFANMAGALMAGLMIDHAGYRAAFLALAPLPFLAWLWVRGAPEAPPDGNDAGSSGTAWNLLREAPFRRLLLLNWVSSVAIDAHTVIVPVLGHERGLSASVIGMVLGSFAIATAAIRLAMPAFVEQVREWKLIAGALGVAAIFFLLYPFATTPLAMCVCAAGLGGAVSCVQPMVMSLLHQVTAPHRHGEAIALRYLLVNASTVATPLVFGLTSGVVGISAVFWFMGCVMGFGSRLGIKMRTA
jgi:MFS family permease